MSTPKGRAVPVPAPRGGARKLGAALRFLVSTPKGRAVPVPAIGLAGPMALARQKPERRTATEVA